MISDPFARKSIFGWNTAAIGTPDKVAGLLFDGGFEAVQLHGQNLNAFRSLHSRREVDTYHAAGLAVVGSVAVYGFNPAADGQASAALAKEYDVDGWIFDIEQIFDDRPNSNSNAVKMLQTYRAIVPDLPTAWCSWPRFFSDSGSPWHPVDVMRAAMVYCDYGMPMVYSPNIDNLQSMLDLLSETFVQWRRYTKKPLIPAGRAYNGEGYMARPECVAAFASAVRVAGCPGISWWALEYALKLPLIWQALRQTPGMVKIDQPPPVVVETQLDRIERGVNELLRRA